MKKRDKIVQISVGLTKRQLSWIKKHKSFDINKFVRYELDEYIRNIRTLKEAMKNDD